MGHDDDDDDDIFSINFSDRGLSNATRARQICNKSKLCDGGGRADPRLSLL